ncbi:small unique nuclear receptor co-repressor [Fusarium beomiforme]|uniref:Exosome complex protein n=1 Tax=Fusarium beomiforme TaxID=44412 RepID=A0A9P5AGQ7_9HYPO|nr:small unique nuclear receptor co-repressor [Fusarium beomiforme]
MTDVKDITPDLDRLDDQLDDLEEKLQPLLDNLEGMASQLPLLDKAKLFSLTAYAIESLMFCELPGMRAYKTSYERIILTFETASLKLNEGNDTQTQAVLTELKRIQQYFGKIKNIESPPEPETRTLTLNQEATARVLKADLGDNKTISNKLAEKIAEERAKALLKSVENRKRPAEESPVPSQPSSSAEGKDKSKKKQKNKKNKGNN